MMKYRKRSEVVEAVLYTGTNVPDVLAFIGSAYKKCSRCGGTGEYEGEYGPVSCQPCNSRLIPLRTLASPHGVVYADEGDWIIKGAAGEVYSCKPDVFQAIYELEPHSGELDA